MECLPIELIQYICRWIKLRDYRSLSLVNTYFDTAIKTNHFYLFCKENQDGIRHNMIPTLMQNSQYFIQFFSTHKNWFDKEKTLVYASSPSHKDIAWWLISTQKYLFEENFDAFFYFILACRCGCLEMAKFLQSHFPNKHQQDDLRSRNEWMECFITSIKWSWDHIEVVRWLISNWLEYIAPHIKKIFMDACYSASVKIVELLVDKFPRLTENINNRCFELACVNGKNKIVKYLHKIKPDINLLDIAINVFPNVCENGHLKTAQWLYFLCKECSKHVDIDIDIFKRICLSGNVLIIEWLFNEKIIDPESMYNFSIGVTFELVCERGHLAMAKLLLEMFPNDTTVCHHEAFQRACLFGRLDTVRWFLEYNPAVCYFIGSANLTKSFSGACVRNNLEMALCMIQINPQVLHYVEIQDSYDEIFNCVCCNGHLDMAKWLLKLFPKINIKMSNDKIFQTACKFNHLRVAEWLTTLCSEYVIIKKYPQIKYVITEKVSPNQT